MTDDRDRSKKLARDAGLVVEDVAAGVIGVAVGVHVGPVGGALVGSSVKMFGGLIRRHISNRHEDRLLDYEAQLEAAAQAVDPSELEWLVADVQFREVAYQNFRRAVDAVDPCVLPALARLTFEARETGIDRFVRATGRLLEQLTANEFRCARDIVTAAAYVHAAVVSIVPWRGTRGVEELRLSTSRRDRYTVDASARREITYTRGIRADGPFREVLDLMARSGLGFIPPRSGHDVGSVGDFDIALDVAQRLLRVIEASDVEVYEATFDRLPETPSAATSGPSSRPRGPA